jgi:hypothetical protein
MESARRFPPLFEPIAAPDSSRTGTVVETDIPTRFDSLPFDRFHLLVIVALGVT